MHHSSSSLEDMRKESTDIKQLIEVKSFGGPLLLLIPTVSSSVLTAVCFCFCSTELRSPVPHTRFPISPSSHTQGRGCRHTTILSADVAVIHSGFCFCLVKNPEATTIDLLTNILRFQNLNIIWSTSPAEAVLVFSLFTFFPPVTTKRNNKGRDLNGQRGFRWCYSCLDIIMHL